MSALRARLGAADPWVAVVGLVSLVVYALHGFDGVIKRDLGVYLYGAQRFLAGRAARRWRPSPLPLRPAPGRPR